MDVDRNGCLWLSNTTLLLQHGYVAVKPEQFFEIFDIATRQRTPLVAFGRKFYTTFDENGYDLKVSDDGQWLAWTGKHQNICFMDIKGNVFFQVKMPGDVRFYWIENSHQVLVCCMNKEIVSKAALYNVDRRQQNWLTLSSDSKVVLGIDTVATRGGHLILENDSDLLLPHKTASPKWLHLEEYVLRPSVEQINLSTIPLPLDGYTGNIAISLDGTQVVYTNFTLQDRWLQKKWNSVFPHVSWRIATETMFLRKANGEILNLGAVSYDALDDNPGIKDIRWLPDGKGVSFVFHKKLYTKRLPAN